MKISIVVLAGLVSTFLSVAALADVRTDCNPGYGPSESNLMVLMDDEQPGEVLSIGYSIIGNYFELVPVGCSRMSVAGKNLLCDGVKVGTAGRIFISVDDPGYNGPRAQIQLDRGKFEISGSCRGTLTLTIRK